MRSNIISDDNPVNEAFKYAGNIHAKKELIEVALKEFVSIRKIRNLRDLKGKIQFDDTYDYKKICAGE
ncbi:MAG: type II toxin-antitoxin system VapB family antitoxin [Desulfobacteraceae bacterium]|nr:MAG: type II toxin-antitoxin system VapB family antitoxin [Desulfobacteraceae bacterium]